MAKAMPSYRRDRVRLPAAQRRRQIVEAASQVIAERGFWGLSMQDVADRTGLTVPGLLRHVGSKAGLLIAVVEDRDAADAEALAAELGIPRNELPEQWARSDAGGIGLPQLCAAIVRRNAARRESVRLFTVLQVESLDPAHPAHDFFVARQERTLAGFAELAKGHADDPDAVALQAMSMMDGLQIQWLRSAESVDLVERWESAAAVIFSGFPG
ncbi:TetR/AcrR family transcriptional regulator [Spirillospora sp. CA-255316]